MHRAAPLLATTLLLLAGAVVVGAPATPAGRSDGTGTQGVAAAAGVGTTATRGGEAPSGNVAGTANPSSRPGSVAALPEAAAALLAEGGSYLVRTYSELDHGGSPQSWCVHQDGDGRIWVGNSAGLLEYDGAAWRRHELPGRGPVRGLTRDLEGRIWFCGGREYGRLGVDAKGRTEFVSVAGRLPRAAPDFQQLWSTAANAAGTWFSVGNAVLLASGDDSLRVYPTAGGAGNVLRIGERVVWVSSDHEICFGEPDGSITRGPLLAGPRFLTLCGAQLPDGTFVFGNYDGVHRRLPDGRLEPFGTEETRSALVGGVYTMAAVPGGLALGTVGAGVVFVDSSGHLLGRLDSSRGLPDDIVLGLFFDRDGALWAALDSGIARIDLGACFLRWGPERGLRGGLLDLHVAEDALWLAGSHGLWELPRGEERFRLHPTDQVWDLEPWDGELLLATSRGLAAIRDGGIVRSLRGEPISSLLRTSDDPAYFVTGDFRGRLRFFAGAARVWSQVDSLDLDDGIMSLAQADDGSLFASTLTDGLRRIVPASSAGPATILAYRQAEGIVPGISYVWNWRGRILAGTDAGLLEFDPAGNGSGRFVPSPLLAAAGEFSARPIHAFAEDGDGVLWLVAGDDVLALRPEGESYLLDPTPMGSLPPRGGGFLHVDGRGRLWAGRDDGLFLHVSPPPAPPVPLSLVLRSITTPDSLVLGGAGGVRSEPTVLSDGAASLRFEFAATSLARPEAILYSTRLDGLESEWGGWTRENWRDYTNLPSGRYTFEVRARDIEGREGQLPPLILVLPPAWYATTWFRALAVLGASALFVGLGSAINRLRVRVLEDEVRARTQDLAEAVTELERARAEAVSATEAKSAFLATVSHEIRTPIAGIIGLDDLLLDEPLSPAQRDLVAASRNSAEHLLRLVDDMLDLTRVEAGRLELVPLAFDPRALVDNLRRFLAAREDPGRLRLTLTVAPEVPSRVIADPLRVRQVLLNLVSNAVKFTPQGEVEVTLALDPAVGDRLAFSVRDTGIGIPAELRAVIFEPFVQADTSSSRRYGGTGLGLSICRQLVGLMGGEIGVESEVGKGSIFRFSIPYQRAADASRVALGTVALDPPMAAVPAGAAQTTPTPEPPATRAATDPADTASPALPHRILLAEDDPVIQTVVARTLQRHGFEVDVVENGESAVDAVVQGPYALVLMDCQMPEVDGFEATRRIRRQSGPNGRIPILALTAHGMDQDRRRCAEAGMDGHLVKPVSEERLIAEVRTRLGGIPSHPAAQLVPPGARA